MRKVLTLVSFTAFLVLTGCVPSLQPLYTDEDLTFDPALLGTWRGEDPGDTWEFTQGHGTEYHLVVNETASHSSDGGTGEFTVHLVMVDGMRFLDLFPDEPNCPQSSLFLVHLVPVHTFWRVLQVEPSLKLAYFSCGEGAENRGWLQSSLETDPTAIRHEQVGGGILLSAAPKELQKFLLAHLQEGFVEATELERQPPEEEPEEE